MKEKKIYLAAPHMSEEGYELQYIKEAFDTNWIAPLGNNVNEFEKEFASFLHIKSAVALSSGTAAVHMALKAAGVGDGDIVFCQSLTFAATANPILYERAVPVFIDSEEATWNMDPEALKEAFLKYIGMGKRPKAVLVVHLYGLPADMDRISALCDLYGAVLIEDAAESLGSLYKGRYTGTIGSYGVFSFNGNKIITTSGGGMLVSNEVERNEKVKFWSTQAKEPYPYYEHKELGYNYRMSNITAGIGRGQLKVLSRRLQRKKEIFEFYQKELACLPDIAMMPVAEGTEPNYWLSCITLSGQRRPIDLIQALNRENTEARHLWKPMHLQPLYRDYDFIGAGTSEKLFLKGVCLPSDTRLTEEELGRVVQIIRKEWERSYEEG